MTQKRYTIEEAKAYLAHKIETVHVPNLRKKLQAIKNANTVGVK